MAAFALHCQGYFRVTLQAARRDGTTSRPLLMLLAAVGPSTTFTSAATCKSQVPGCLPARVGAHVATTLGKEMKKQLY